MKQKYFNDTVAAIATPAGEGGIAVLRVSGPHALIFSKRILSYKGTLRPRTVKLAALSTGEVSDEVMLLYFKSPRSFTGEDVLEIHCHGSYFLAQKVVEALLQNGCRAAEPGEFTRRAFLNGRIDLTKAEAVLDLIRAKSQSEVTAAYRQLRGGIFNEADALQKRLTDLIASASAAVDYPEDDIISPAKREILDGAQSVKLALTKLKDSFKGGRLLREGVRVAIIGLPNAGKSTLLNRLLGAERAIVTAEPGTTRDTVEETFIYRGVRFVVTDTAGIRAAATEAERLGIQRSLAAAEGADVILRVEDGTGEANITELTKITTENKPVIVVKNKLDLARLDKTTDNTMPCPSSISISALTGENVELLKERLYGETVGKISAHGASICNLRQLDAVTRAAEALERLSISEQLSLDCMLSDLYEASRALGSITGITATDAVVDAIFAQFCVGK